MGDHHPNETITENENSNKSNIVDPIQDLFEWFGNLTKIGDSEIYIKRWNDYVNKINENRNKNVDDLARDLKKFYNKVENMIENFDIKSLHLDGFVRSQDSLKMTAEEIRQRTISELYEKIKLNVFYSRDVCKCVHETTCVSVLILEEVKKRLVDEGFEVVYVINDKLAYITIEW